MYCLYLIRFRLVQVLNMQFYQSSAILGDNVHIFISNHLLSLVYMISYFTEYIDSQLVNRALSLCNQYTDGFYYLVLKVLPTDNRFDSVTHTPFKNYASKSIHQIRISIFIVLEDCGIKSQRYCGI